MQKLKWGILSTAKIGTEKVIPAMQKSERCTIIAIASRDESRARSTANVLNIPKYYGSYQELLDDPFPGEHVGVLHDGLQEEV